MQNEPREFIRLRDLLSGMRSDDFSCLADLHRVLASGVATPYAKTGAVARRELIDTYTVRKKIDDERHVTGSLIQGLDSLLTTLEHSDEAELMVHGLKSDEGHFTVFTDLAISKVLGIIRSRIGV